MPVYEIQAPNGRIYEIEGPEGATDSEVAAEVLRQFPEAEQSAPRSVATPNATPTKDARLVIGDLFPSARITDWKRDPNSALGRANPSSWHNRSGAAVDMPPIPGMTYEDAVKRFEDAGYVLIEAIDEVKHPSGHATGPHWHFVVGIPEGGLQPKSQPQEPTMPTAQDAPASGDSRSRVATQPSNDNGGRFFGLPTLEQAAKGLEYGTGAIVEGLGDAVGIVANPLATSLGRAMNYDSYTADLGGDLRDGLGLDRPTDTANRIAGDVVSGAAGGLGFSGGARLAGKVAQSALAKEAFAQLGSTPMRDAISGGTSAIAADTAEDMGAGAVGQTVAAVAGGMAGYGGASAAMSALPKAKAIRFAQEQARNPFVVADAEVARDVRKIASNLVAKTNGKQKLSALQEKTLLSRVNSLERSYLPTRELNVMDLPPSIQARLKAAIAKRHLMSDTEVASLRDGTPAGNAVADGITKARRLRAYADGAESTSTGTIGRHAAEALGTAAGYSIGGGLGGAAGSVVGRVSASALAKALKPSASRSSAKAILDLAAKAPKFDALPAVQFGRTATGGSDSLSRETAEALDAPYLARKNAEAETARLSDEGRKVAMQNARDDIRPGGGLRGLMYDRAGILPSQQDVGALKALAQGKITPQHFDDFLNNPEALMTGKVGLSLMDRLASMADDGTLQRNPKWNGPPEASQASAQPMVDAQGAPIRSLPAYQAGAAKNIAKELDLMRRLDEIDPVQGSLADGAPIRASEAGLLNDADTAKANIIRAQLAALKPAARQPQ